jgi:DNA polymerase III epsilon subunit family exonuclease
MEFICLDIETTGLDNTRDSIIEFAAVRFTETEILDEYQTFIDTDAEIPPIVEHLTGIKKEMLEGAPELEEVKQKIYEFCGHQPIMGHNINFDLGFLDSNNITLPNIRIDTLPISQVLVEDSPSYSLETLCRNNNKTHQPSHRAMDDVKANVELFQDFLRQIQNLNPHQAYLWNKIIQNSASDIASIFSDYIPKKQTEPKFKPLSESHNEAKNNQSENQEINFKEGLDFSKIEDNSLIVTSRNKVDKYKNEFTVLPRIWSLISPVYFLQEIEKGMLTQEQTYLLLKIATRIKEDEPIYKTDLKIFGEDHEHINNVLYEKYMIPKSEKPYLVDHQTFFTLNQRGDLPNVDTVYFDNLPFLEEKLIRSQEKIISLHRTENGEITDDTTVLFGQLGMYLNRIFTDTSNPFEHLMLEPIEAQSTNFRNFLTQVIELTTNEELKSEVEELKSNTAYYLIWVKLSDGQAPTIHFIEKDIEFDLEEILKQTGYSNIQICNPASDSTPFFINTNESYPEPNKFGHDDEVINQIKSQFDNIEKEGLILSTSRAQMTDIHSKLAQHFTDKGINLLTQGVSGSKGKILDNIENREAPVILVCTYQFFLAFRPALHEIEQAMITRMPMLLPNHPYYDYLKKQVKNDFEELVIPRAASLFYEITNQISELSPETDSITLMDKRLETTGWGIKIKQKFPTNLVSEIQN